MTFWENALVVAGLVAAYGMGIYHGHRAGLLAVIARNKE
jgi:hypothetical protein